MYVIAAPVHAFEHGADVQQRKQVERQVRRVAMQHVRRQDAPQLALVDDACARLGTQCEERLARDHAVADVLRDEVQRNTGDGQAARDDGKPAEMKVPTKQDAARVVDGREQRQLARLHEAIAGHGRQAHLGEGRNFTAAGAPLEFVDGEDRLVVALAQPDHLCRLAPPMARVGHAWRVDVHEVGRRAAGCECSVVAACRAAPPRKRTCPWSAAHSSGA
jgi:hypothetical protein